MNILALPPVAQTVLLLALSNVFMIFAWYAHLKNVGHKPWVVAALGSWGIALFEYLLQVPANRIGYTVMSLPQLKIMQEVIAAAVTAADAATLAAPHPNEGMRKYFPTVGDMVVFMMTSHEMDHLGQLAAWRRAMGLAPR